MKNDGGPAFPVTFEHSYGVDSGTKSQEWQGMSLRDYFAAAALPCVRADGGRYGPEGAAQVAKYSYAIADALLAERAKSLTSKE